MSDPTTPDTISDPADQPGPVTSAPSEADAEADASESPESPTTSSESSAPSSDPDVESGGTSSPSPQAETPSDESSESSEVAPGLYIEIGPGVIFRAREADRSRLLDTILSGGMVPALDANFNIVVINATAAPYLRVIDASEVTVIS